MGNIIGHDSIISFFEKGIREGNLSHAYIFFGAPHVGKYRVAEEIARMLFKKNTESLVHPDFIVVKREIDEKTGMLKKDISITQIRDLIHRLSQSAFVQDGYVVALIDGAEHLNLSGANALLKSLEEPRTKTVVILISQDQSLLLPTIRSRAQSIYFAPVAEHSISEALVKKGIDAEHARTIARDAHGIPGYALEWAHNPHLYEEYVLEKSRFKSLIGARFHEKLAVIEHFFEQKEDHIEARGKIIEALNFWTLALRDMIVLEGADFPRGAAVLDRIADAKVQLRGNIHPRLILEHLVLSIP